MAKILLVGLGGTGSRIVVDVEQIINRLPEESRKDITVATLGIDTHDQFLSDIQDPISSLQINTDVITLIRNIDEFPHIKKFWNPEVTPRDTSNGAGGIRILSRVSVFRHADKIHQKIGENLDKLAAIRGKGMIYVFVVGSLFGGTGSGAFIDIANIIANKLRENLAPTDFRIIGHFFLPSILPSRTQRNFENTYASLQEYEYLLTQKEYKISYSPTMTDFWTDTPYQNIFLISGFTQGNLTLPGKPEDFYKMVAHKISFEIISQTLFKEFMGKLIDIHILADVFEYKGGIKKPTAFSSFGLSAIAYPFDNIRRYYALKAAATIMSRGFLGSYDRDEVEKQEIKDFLTKNYLDKLDRQIKQNKEVSFEIGEMRFNKADYDKNDKPLERVVDDLQYDYDQMKTVKFDKFYKTVEKAMNEMKKTFRAGFILEIKRLIKSFGFVKAQIFIDLLLQNLSLLERKYLDEFKKFERISDDAALEVVQKELEDVHEKAKNWWPMFKKNKVMKELDEFIEEANNYVDCNSSEIINEYAARLVSDMQSFIRKFFQPGGKQGPPGGFLERVKTQVEAVRRNAENTFREVGTYISEEKSRENEYKVIRNLKSLDELNRIYDEFQWSPSEQFTLLTNEYMPELMLDPDKIASMEDQLLEKEMEAFNLEALNTEMTEKIFKFAYKFFDENLTIFKPENIISAMNEDEIVARIDDMIRYCSPFLGYKEHIGRIEHAENTMIMIRKAAYNKVADRIKQKYGGNYFFMPTDDVDFLMIMKYSHGYDLNSLTEIESIAMKYKALNESDSRKRHIDNNWFEKLSPILVKDIKVVSTDSYFYFACGLFFKLGEDFAIDFGAGRGKANPEFKDRFIIDRTESGINFKYLDWTGKDKYELEMGRTIMDAFRTFENNDEMLESIRQYEKKFMDTDSKGYKQKLETAWNMLHQTIIKLNESTKANREDEAELYKNMADAIDKSLADMN